MSLLAWFPFNGNINNQGLSNSYTISGTPSYSDGKTGKCIASNVSITITPKETMPITKGFSFSTWVYCSGVGSSTVWWKLFNITYSDSSQHNVYVAEATRYKYEYSPELNLYVDTVNTWHHITYVYDGTTLKGYCDGVLKGSSTYSKAFVNISKFVIGGGSSSCKLADFRVYDHCLSAKEVKEISKGLILHYKLDNNGIGNPNLFKSFSTGGHTSLRNNNLVIAQQDTITDTYFYINTEPIEADVEYTFSVAYDGFRGASTWNFPMFGQSLSLAILKLEPNKNFASVTFTIPTGNSNVGATKIILDDSGRPTSNPNEVVVYNAKLEKGNKATPWCPNSSDAIYSNLGFNINQEIDVSGYKNNGTKIGSIGNSTNCPRYNSCIFSPNGTDHIKAPNPIGTNPSEVTISYWYKPSASNTAYQIIAANYNNPSSGFWLSTNTESVALWCYVNGLYVRGAATVNNNTWYHMAITYKNGTYQWYLNGVPVATTLSTTSKPFTITEYISIMNGYSGTSWSGCKNYGSLSDFRIYATALSADDIKELYTVSASIDKNGNLFCGEVVEE